MSEEKTFERYFKDTYGFQLPDESVGVREPALPTESDQDYLFKLQRALIRRLDYRFGINGSFHDDIPGDNVPTKSCYVRDARQLTDLPPMSPDHPVVLADNMLLRAVQLTRGIDHILEYQMKQTHVDRERKENGRKFLKSRVQKLLSDVVERQSELLNTELSKNKREIIYKEILKLEKDFYSDLIRFHHANDLDIGLKKPEEYRGLFDHIRDLAVTLDPAPAMMTLVKDKARNVVQIETAYPITSKTEKQKNALREVSSTHQTPAILNVNQAFKDLLEKDDRRLPHRTRKSVAPTVKNGYATCLDIIQLDDKSKIAKQQKSLLLRAGSLVYLGKGKSDDKVVEDTKENYAQLNEAHKKISTMHNVRLHEKQHHTLLNSSAIGAELKIVRMTKRAAKDLSYEVSHLGTHWHGAHSAVSGIIKVTRYLWDKVRRVKQAALATYLAEPKGYNSLVSCASGRDRTGTAEEITRLYQMLMFYIENDLIELTGVTKDKLKDPKVFRELILSDNQDLKKMLREMEKVRRVGLHQPMLASWGLVGNFGMIKSARPSNLFDAETNEFYYTNVASDEKCKHYSKTAARDVLTLKPEEARIPELQAIITLIEGFVEERLEGTNYSPFLSGYDKKAKALIKLQMSINEYATSPDKVGKTLRQIVEEWLLSGDGSVTIGAHRAHFFKPESEEKTQTRKFIDHLLKEYGDVVISAARNLDVVSPAPLPPTVSPTTPLSTMRVR